MNVVGNFSDISPMAGYFSSFFEDGISLWATLLLCAFLTWVFFFVPNIILSGFLDRKIGADIQSRLGPNRVGRFGLFQWPADFIKLLLKEDRVYRQDGNRIFKFSAMLAACSSFLAVCFIPLSQDWTLVSLDSSLISIVFLLVFVKMCLFAFSYSSNDNPSILASFRVISLNSLYFVPLLFSILGLVIVLGTVDLKQIVENQGGWPWQWNIFKSPGMFFLFFTFQLSLMIWVGNQPFDLEKPTGELSGGVSSMAGGLNRVLFDFFGGASLLILAALTSSIFLGGWRVPFQLDSFGRAGRLIEFLFLQAKILCFMLLNIWIKWSLPRLNYKQIVHLTWNVLVPISFISVLMNVLWIYLFSN